MNQAQKIMSGFDISNLDSDVVNEVTHRVPVIEDIDGEPVSGFIIVGKNSPQHQGASTAVRVANIQRSGKRKQQIDTSTEAGAELLARTVENNERTIAMAVVVGWFGFTSNGKEMEFNKAIVEKMFNKYPQWQVRVSTALEQDSNFMKV